MHQVVWNNKYITVQKLSTFEKHFYSKGVFTVGDLLSVCVNANVSPLERFKLMGIIDAIPREWRQIIRQSTQHLPPSHIGDTIYLTMENSPVAL